MATQIDKKQLTSKAVSRSNEIAAIILLALAILLFLCLVTYSPNDWSRNSTGLAKTQNWIGIVGAVVSDELLQFIGLTAYFLPALMALIAWRFYS
jgi:S-DNA-T family DNA segregation ATPase FtsK/SpoIIIE